MRVPGLAPDRYGPELSFQAIVQGHLHCSHLREKWQLREGAGNLFRSLKLRNRFGKQILQSPLENSHETRTLCSNPAVI